MSAELDLAQLEAAAKAGHMAIPATILALIERVRVAEKALHDLTQGIRYYFDSAGQESGGKG